MARINGNGGNNTLTGTKSADGIYGYGGNDTISGGGGDDYLHGGTGIDRLFGGAGDDRMNVTTVAKNFTHTGTTYELMDGGTGRDNAHVDAKGSAVDGMETHVVYMNYAAPNTYTFHIDGGEEDGFGAAPLAQAVNVESFVLAPDGPVLSFLGNIGGTGSDITVTATNGNDYYCGGGENSNADLLAGNDTAIISTGHDVFAIGAGFDVVKFTGWYNGARDGVITDFNTAEDVLDLSGWAQDTLTVTDTSGGTWLSGNGSQLFLAGVTGYNPWDTAIIG